MFAVAPARLTLNITQHTYVSLQAVHDNINMSSDIVHYLGCCIIRFMPSYGRFQYSRVLYHDYEQSGRWDAVCISLRQNEVDQYTRGGWFGGLCMCERDCVCVCVDRQPWEIRVHNCLQLQTVPLFLSLTHTAVFLQNTQAQTILTWATFRCRDNIITQYISLSPPSPLCWLQTSWSHISSVTQQADRQESSFCLLSFKCRFTSCLRQELRCLFRMRSA